MAEIRAALMGRELNWDSFFACFHEGLSGAAAAALSGCGRQSRLTMEPVLLGAWGTQRVITWAKSLCMASLRKL